MRVWGKKSKEVLDELDPRLARIMERVLNEVADISLTEGHRDENRQNYLFDQGFSKVRYPDGKHNVMPSKAVDFQPYPYPRDERILFASLAYIAGAAIQIAKQEGVKLRWGGDWNRNGQVSDESFHDLFHLELDEPSGVSAEEFRLRD